MITEFVAVIGGIINDNTSIKQEISIEISDFINQILGTNLIMKLLKISYLR